MAPQIPTYTAQIRAVEQDYPRDVPVEDFSGLAVTGQQLQKTGQEVAQIGAYYKQAEQKIESLRVKNNVIGVKSAYTAGLNDVIETIRIDGTITTREQAEVKFREEEKKLRAASFKAADTPLAKYEIDNHIKATFGEFVNRTRHLGNEKATAYNIGQLDRNRDALMELAANEPDRKKVDDYYREYTESLDYAFTKGHINAHKRETDKISFRNGVWDKKANIMLATENGPEMFRAAIRHKDEEGRGVFGEMNEKGEWDGMDFSEISRYLVKAKEIDASNERKQEQAHAKETIKVKSDLEYRAQIGTLGDDELQAIEDGKNPYILKHEAAKYREIKTFPPSPQTDLAVKTLMQEYHGGKEGGTVTQARVDLYRAKAQGLGIRSYNPAYSQFLNELSADESTARALGNQQANEAARNIQGKIADQLREPVTGFSPRVDRLINGLNALDKHEVEKAVRATGSRDPIKMETAAVEKIEQILKARQKAIESVTPKQKGVDSLFKD